MTRFIGIVSGKGGVGKTTIAINVGKALTDHGRDVIVLDANISKPNVGIQLGSSVVATSIHDVLRRKKNIRDAVHIHPSGLKVIPGNISLEALDDLDVDNLPEIIKELDGLTEFVIVDTAPGLHEETLQAMQACDELIVITTPDLPAVTDGLKTVKAAERFHKKVTGVIVNRSHNDRFDLPSRNIKAILDKEIWAEVMEDGDMRQALRLNHPISHTHPDNDSTMKFKMVASKLLGETFEQPAPKKQGVQGFLKRLSR